MNNKSNGQHQRFGMRIAGITAYAPRHSISNKRIAARLRLERIKVNAAKRNNGGGMLDSREQKLYATSDRWIQRFIGFKERRFAAEGEGTIDLAARAALMLFDNTKLNPSDINGIIFGTVTPSYLNSPPDSALLQDRLGIMPYDNDEPREFYCVDSSLACSTWVACLRQAYLLISSGMAKNLLVIGADKMSDTINWQDRAFATVLGDAGTAIWCTAVPPEEDWFHPNQFWSWASGRDGDIIVTPAGGSKEPVKSANDLTGYRNRLTMDGALVKELIVPLVGGPGADAAISKAGWSLDMVDIATLHEANLVLNEGIVQEWRKRGFKGDVLDAGGQFGNTTSASIPLALALNPDALKVGRRFLWAAFGGGLTINTALGQIRHEVTVQTAV
jgi:3-oxoacyl-[acyl-carrier-protein] synthase-3